jgi:hypothetical protein
VPPLQGRQREEIRALYAAGTSQRELAARFGVTQTSVFRYCKGITRTVADQELSIVQAADKVGITKETIQAAISDGRLAARFGAPAVKAGRPGRTDRWNILPDDLEFFMQNLGPCRHPHCDELGVTPAGFCGRAHAMSVTMKGALQLPEPRDCLYCGNTITPLFPCFDAQRFCSHKCWGKYRFKVGEHHRDGISKAFIDTWPGRGRQRWRGRWNGKEGALEGNQGGRPPAATKDEAAECWRLHREGLSSRQVSEKVFGDTRYYKRVQRIVAGS